MKLPCGTTEKIVYIDYGFEIAEINLDTGIITPPVLIEKNIHTGDIWRVQHQNKYIIEWRGEPKQIRRDNGSEYISGLLTTWVESKEIKLAFIQPGNPRQNAYCSVLNNIVIYNVFSIH